MDLLIHKEYLDGTVEHEPFSRAAWEEGSTACRKYYAKFCAHAPDDCIATIRDLARIKALSSIVQDTSSVPRRDLPPAPATNGPIIFPPESCSNAHMELMFLCERSGLCIDDVHAILWPKLPDLDLDKLPPMSDKRGQFLLF